MQQVSTYEQQPSLDINSMRHAFIQLLTNPDQHIKKQADQYIAGCEQSPEFSLVLLQLFQNEKDGNAKLQVLLSLKSFLQRNWQHEPNEKLGKHDRLIAEPHKAQIRNALLSLLSSCFEKSFRRHLDLLLQCVIKHDLFKHFPDLLLFFSSTLNQLAKYASDSSPTSEGMILLGVQTFAFLKTLKCVLKELAKKRLAASKKVFQETVTHFIVSLKQLWGYYTNCLEQMQLPQLQMQMNQQVPNSNNNLQFLNLIKLSRVTDAVLILSLNYQQNDHMIDPFVLNTIESLIGKAGSLFNLMQPYYNQAQAKGDQEVFLCLNKSYTKLLYSLSNLQFMLSFAFQSQFYQFMTLITNVFDTTTNAQEQQQQFQLIQLQYTNTANQAQILSQQPQNIVQFSDENTIKCAGLALLKLLKSQVFYCDAATYAFRTKTQPRLKDSQVAQAQCHAQFLSFFNQQQIEKLLKQFIFQVMPEELRKESESAQLNSEFEYDIENENDSLLENMSDELENTAFNILLQCVKALLHGFPYIALPFYVAQLDVALQNQFQNTSVPIQDCLFAVLGLLPRAFDAAQDIDFAQIRIFQVVQYLQSNYQMNLFYAKRIPILVSRWLDKFQQDVIQQAAQIVMQVMLSATSDASKMVRYECCMCMKNILKKEGFICADYAQLLEQMAPVIISLFGQIDASHVLWPLMNLMTTLIEKSQYTCGNAMLAALGSEAFSKLLGIKDPLIQGALVDMLKTLIVSFPPATPIQSIYLLSLKFIDANVVDQTKGKVNNLVLKLWFFVTKECTPIQQVESYLQQLFFKHINDLNKDTDDQNITQLLYLMEELLLLGCISLSEETSILQIVEQKYLLSQSILFELAIQIKEACLNVLATLFLIYLNRTSNQTTTTHEFEKYHPCLKHVVTLVLELAAQLQTGTHALTSNILSLTSQALTLINRYFILDDQAAIAFVSQVCPIQDFFQAYLKNMENLKTRIVTKINAFALLKVLKYFQLAQLLQNFVFMMRILLPEVQFYIDSSTQQAQIQIQTQTQTKNRMNRLLVAVQKINDTKVSERKEALRKMHTCDSINLKAFFVQTIQSVLQMHNVATQEHISQLFQGDEALIKQFYLMLQ